MIESKIKRANVAIFEINFDLLIPFNSRTNEFTHISELPLVEKDLCVVVDESVTWKELTDAIKSRVKSIDFIEEYRGNQIPEGKKSIVFRFKVDNQETTMTSEEINNIMNGIIKVLNKKCGAVLREE